MPMDFASSDIFELDEDADDIEVGIEIDPD